MLIRNSFRAHLAFDLKLAAAIGLVALADILFFGKKWGSTLGLFAIAWVFVLAVAVPSIAKNRSALIALGCAAALGVPLVDDPSLLSMALFWVGVSSAVLFARRDFRDASHHALRLFAQGMLGPFTPFRDLFHVARLPRPNLRSSFFSALALLALPIAGGTVFIWLFAQANPLMARMLPSFALPTFGVAEFMHLIFWLAVFAVVWPTMRPSGTAMRFLPSSAGRILNLPGVSPASVFISLTFFNLIFAAENLLDIVFLWSGAPLPQGVTMADYAHRGAYPLIVTALLAGAFVLITAQPDSEIGRRPSIRHLVVLWIAQNLVLVTSSIIRTVDYIDAYMLTRLRIAALIWMMLVAVGLVLICWRMIARRSLTWLINSTVAAGAFVLALISVVDLGSLAADWNVRHAREAGGTGQPLDLGYLRTLGPSAMVSLAYLESRPLAGRFEDRVSFVRAQIVRDTIENQETPYGWTWRNARRLDAVKALLGSQPRAAAWSLFGREWDGTIKQPPEVPALSAPLTPKVYQ